MRPRYAKVHPSSGTTGSPVNTLWSAADVDAIADMTARRCGSSASTGGLVQKRVRLWTLGRRNEFASACSKLGVLVIPTGTGVPTLKQIDYLRRAAPQCSCPRRATPFTSRELAKEGLGSDDIALRLGCFGGEAGAENPATRQRSNAGSGSTAFDYYGSPRWPTFASECAAKAGLHFAEDHILVECLDPETKRSVGRRGAACCLHASHA